MIFTLRKILHFSGVISRNCTKKNLNNNYIFRWIMLIAGMVYLIISFGDLVIKAKTLEEISQNCNLNIAGWQAVLKCLLISQYMPGVISILEEMEGITLSAYHMSLAKKMFYIRASMAMFSATYFLLNAVVFTNSGYPFRAWLPYDNHENLTTYWLTVLLLTFLMYYVCMLSITIENLISINLIYMAEELQMVQRQISKIGVFEKRNDSETTLESDLIKCVQEQQKIYELRICHIKICY